MAEKQRTIKAIELETVETKRQVDVAYEKQFVKGDGPTVYLVLEGKRLAFRSWQQLADNFGIVPQYDAEHMGGVHRVAQVEIDAIPDGGLFS